MAFHMMAAGKVPEFAMTQGEADQLAKAICNYLRHTDIKMTQKTQDFVSLIFAIGMIEGTRIIAATQGVKTRRQIMERQVAARPATGPAPANAGRVVPMTPGSIPGAPF